MDRCPHIIRKCSECLDKCKLTGDVCVLEHGWDCSTWDDEQEDERENTKA